MKISLYSIEKSVDGNIKSVTDSFVKMSSRFAEVKDITLFGKDIAAAQSKGVRESKASYTAIYEPHLKGYTIALDEQGDELTSVEFIKIFENGSDIRFFIGGAYGFEESFLARTQRVISLSRLTYAHKIVKMVLSEQIYRGLCIKNNHPYHKE